MPDESGPLAGALSRFLEQQGLAKRLEQAAALEAWPEVVGPAVAAATNPLSISSDGTLLVGVRSSAWMNELTMMERELIAAVNRANPSVQVRRIRWQLIP